MLDLYTTMAAGAGVDTAAQHAPARAGELQRSSLDATRAKLHLGWEPFTEAVLRHVASLPGPIVFFCFGKPAEAMVALRWYADFGVVFTTGLNFGSLASACS